MVKRATTSGSNYDFACHASAGAAKRQANQDDEVSFPGAPLTSLWLGFAAERLDNGCVKVGYACHDGTYTMDSAIDVLEEDTQESMIYYLIDRIDTYARAHAYKFMGAGIAEQLLELCPNLKSRLWADLDVVPVALGRECNSGELDEVADSMARKCVMLFAPDRQLRLHIGHHNDVQADLEGRASFTTIQQYLDNSDQETKRMTEIYAKSVKGRKKKIAFFSATPRGGGVALMRHSLLRYFRLLGVDCSWWVPNPKPAVFRITKTNHNLLQGVAKADERFTSESRDIVDKWGMDNAQRLWMQEGYPLAPRAKGGADVVIVDDPQMPVLVSIAKHLDPGRPVIFRSHIQMRSDLIQDQSSEAHAVWAWIWSHVQKADLFVAHPISKFVPAEVPKHKVAYMPATTDWIDGLNKPLSSEATRFYLDEFNSLCHKERWTSLAFPERDYIIQIARFDPSKGFDDCLAAYARFRHESPFCKGKPSAQTPQLLLCGHSSVDDPDGATIFQSIANALENDYSDLKDSVVIMRLGPSDQLLNALLRCSRVALQLSTSEGFEIKVSEALHKGIPVIARNVGGLPLQVQHNKNGFLVQSEDRETEIRTVAEHLHTLFSDKQTYKQMSEYAASHISDEVGTVGNAVCWMYLLDRLTRDEPLQPNETWIWELAEGYAGGTSLDDGVKLPRNLTT